MNIARCLDLFVRLRLATQHGGAFFLGKVQVIQLFFRGGFVDSESTGKVAVYKTSHGSMENETDSSCCGGDF